jgi:hypothetical protein
MNILKELLSIGSLHLGIEGAGGGRDGDVGVHEFEFTSVEGDGEKHADDSHRAGPFQKFALVAVFTSLSFTPIDQTLGDLQYK